MEELFKKINEIYKDFKQIVKGLAHNAYYFYSEGDKETENSEKSRAHQTKINHRADERTGADINPDLSFSGSHCEIKKQKKTE